MALTAAKVMDDSVDENDPLRKTDKDHPQKDKLEDGELVESDGETNDGIHKGSPSVVNNEKVFLPSQSSSRGSFSEEFTSFSFFFGEDRPTLNLRDNENEEKGIGGVNLPIYDVDPHDGDQRTQDQRDDTRHNNERQLSTEESTSTEREDRNISVNESIYVEKDENAHEDEEQRERCGPERHSDGLLTSYGAFDRENELLDAQVHEFTYDDEWESDWLNGNKPAQERNEAADELIHVDEVQIEHPELLAETSAHVDPPVAVTDDIIERNGQKVLLRDFTTPIKRAAALNFFDKKELLSSAVPTKLLFNRKGSQIYLIDRRCFPDTKSLQKDAFKSWCQTIDGTKKAPKWDNDPAGVPVRMKRSRATHPDNVLFRRHIIFLVDDLGNFKSDVIFQYVLLGDDLELPYAEITDTRRASAAEVDEIKEALQNRTTTQAKAHLRAKGKEVDSKQISNIAKGMKDCQKQGSGPRRVTDLGKVTVMADRNPAISISHGGEKLGSKAGTTICILFQDAIAFYAKSCPTKASLVKFKESIQVLETMSREDGEKFINDLLKRRTPSQTFPGFGSGMQPDTTFDLSHLLVTVVVGTLDNVVTSSSGKNAPVILCAMLHDSKEEYHHKLLGSKLAAAFQQLAPDRQVPSFTSDGEKALQLIAPAYDPLKPDIKTPFELTTRLSCDLHCKKNLLHRFGKTAGEFLSLELFGRTQPIDEKWTYLRGLSGALNRAEYATMLDDLQSREPSLYEWVKSRKIDFFEAHSLRSKLEGAFLGQWNTSNIVENMNSQFKIDIKSYLPGEDILDYLQRKNNERMKEVFRSIVGGSKILRLSEHNLHRYRSTSEWEALSDDQRRDHLASFGIRYVNKDYEILLQKLPDWIMSGKKPAVKDHLCAKIRNLEVDAARNFYYVKSSSSDERIAVVRKDGVIYTCSRNECKNSSHSTPCEHIIATLLSFDETKMNDSFDQFHVLFKMTTAKQAMASHVHPTDGGKFQARIGFQPSKNNGKRPMEVVSSSTYPERIAQMAGTTDVPLTKKAKKPPNRVQSTQPSTSSMVPATNRAPMRKDDGQRTKKVQQLRTDSFPRLDSDSDVPQIRSNRERNIQQRLQYTPTGK